jgi:pimeloyl-ACP methyl ester carboxylesterase
MAESNITRRSVIVGVAAGAGLATAVTTSSSLVSPARAQSAPRTYLLIHGAFAGGWCWRRVSDSLEKNGHKVFRPTLTGLGERSHLLSKTINLDTHITDVVNVAKWEDLGDICLVVHSYGGWVGSGVLEHIGDRVSSIIWVDAFKPEDGQRPIYFTSFRQPFLDAEKKGEAGVPPGGKPGPIIVNEKDSAYVESKLTAHPVGTYFQPIKLSGAREKVAKKTYIRATKSLPVFDSALAQCKADKSWSTFEIASGHMVMLDEPGRLTEILLQVA